MSCAVGNGPCGRCGRPDTMGIGQSYWCAPNSLWNEVYGTAHNPCGDGVLRCPECFEHDCRQRGIAIGWRADRVGALEHAGHGDRSRREPWCTCEDNSLCRSHWAPVAASMEFRWWRGFETPEKLNEWRYWACRV